MCRTWKMMRHSVPPRDRVFLKGYRFISFDKNMGKELEHAEKSGTDALKTVSKRVIQKTAEQIWWFNWQ